MGETNKCKFAPPLANLNSVSLNGFPKASPSFILQPSKRYLHQRQNANMLQCQQFLHERVRLRKAIMRALEKKQATEREQVQSKFEITVQSIISGLDKLEQRPHIAVESVRDRSNGHLLDIQEQPKEIETSHMRARSFKEETLDIDELTNQVNDDDETSSEDSSQKASDLESVELDSPEKPLITVNTKSEWNRLSNNVKNEAIEAALDFLDFGSDSEDVDMKVDNLAELRKKRLTYLQAGDIPEKPTLKGTARAIQFIFRVRNARNATRKQKSSTSQENLKEVYELYLAMAIAWTVKIIETPVRSILKMKILNLNPAEAQIVIRNKLFSYWNRNTAKSKENKKIANARRVMKVHFLEVLNELEKAIDKKALPRAILMFIKSSLLVTDSNLSEYLFDSEKKRLNIDEFELLVDLSEEQKMMLLAGFWVNRVIISALAKRSSSYSIVVLQSYFHRIIREFYKKTLNEADLQPRDEEIIKKVGSKLLVDDSSLFADVNLLSECADELAKVMRILLKEIDALLLRKEALK